MPLEVPIIFIRTISTTTEIAMADKRKNNLFLLLLPTLRLYIINITKTAVNYTPGINMSKQQHNY